MFDAAQRRNLITRFVAQREVRASVVHPDDATIRWAARIVVEGDAPFADDGLLVEASGEDAAPMRLPWTHVYELTASRGPLHAAFADCAPADQLGPLAPLPAGPALRAAFDAALRCSPGALDPELEAALEALPHDDRRRLADLGLQVLEQNTALGRGLLLTVGRTGGPEHALRLGAALCAIGDTPADEWRWIYGLQALRLFGTRDAHMQIQRVRAQSLNQEAITAAVDALLQVAADLGVPIWEVQDELVPACGLSSNGHARFDYGTRSFTLQLDDHLRPFLREVPGQEIHYDLPTPRPEDDPSNAAEARQRWAVVRAQLTEAVPVQAHRFEEALAQQTRWTGRQWDQVVRRHPLLTHLVPRVVWGTYSGGGRKLLDTFRVDADRTLWGADDEPYELDPERTIGIAHPLEMSDELRAAWGQILADYEVVTMFPQIDRHTARPATERARETEVELELEIPGVWPLVQLRRNGWRKHDAWGGDLEKVFRNRDVKAVLSLSEEDNRLTLHSVSFMRYLTYPQTQFQLRDVSPIPYSETLYELEQLRMPQETGGWPAVPSRR